VPYPLRRSTELDQGTTCPSSIHIVGDLITEENAVPYATVETVRDAVAALHEQGVQPSIPKIRRHLGGGSHTTILRCLNEIREAPPAPEEDAVSSDTGELSSAIRAEITAVDSALRKLEERIRQTITREIAEEQRRLRDAHQIEIDQLKASISDAWSRTEAATRETQDVCDELDRAQEGLENLRQETEQIRQERDELIQSKDQLREELQSLEQERDRLAAERDAANAAAEAARSEAERADRACASALAERTTALSERDTATAALDQTRAELRQTAQSLSGAEATVTARDSALASCRDEIDQLRSRCAELQASIRQAEAARGTAEGQLAAVEAAHQAERDAWQRERAELLNRLPLRKSGSGKSSATKPGT
jgi:chromosome segregation protein